MAAVRVDPGRVREFADAQSFYDWLGEHWHKEPEVWIKIHKVRSGRASITPVEAIDAALCWGWIDAIRKGFDETSFLQRYTPRGKKSVWSKVNVANVERLTAAGRMRPPGLAQVDAAKADGRWARAYSMTSTQAPDDLIAAIRAVPRAQAMYETLSSQNRFALTFRTLAPKTPAGRQNAIERFVAMLARGETIYPNGKGAAASAKGASAKGASAKGASAKGASAKKGTSAAAGAKSTSAKGTRAPAGAKSTSAAASAKGSRVAVKTSKRPAARANASRKG